MVKKKRQSEPHNNDESSTDSDDKPTSHSNSPLGSTGTTTIECQHVKKSVDIQKLRKMYKTSPLDMSNCCMCQLTLNKVEDANDIETMEESFDFDKTLWLCLKCGTHLCGRGKNQHALKHFEIPHSDSHSLALNTTTFSIWCYSCDDEVNLNTRKQLSETVEYIKKLSHKPPPILPQILTPTPTDEQKNEGCLRTDHLNLRLSYANNCVASTSGPPVNTAIPGMARRVQTTISNALVPIPIETLPRVRGLTNLGNTCFFNAVLQCLAQTPFLLEVLTESSEPGEKFTLPGGEFVFKEGVKKILPPIEGELSSWGGLTLALAQALEELQSGGGVFSPSKLFVKLTTKCPQFRGGDQHDSHELLRHLLESVRSEDLQRYQKVILNALGYKGQDINSVDQDMKQKCKIYGQQAQDRILRPEQVFRGFLVSTLTCQECFYTSSRHENFLDMSLPVSVEKPPPPTRRKTSPETSPMNNSASKYKLKKDKEKERKAKRAAKHHNKKALQIQNLAIAIGPAGDIQNLSNDNTVRNENSNSKSSDSSSTEQSDADIEDNLIDDAPKNTNDVLNNKSVPPLYDPNGNNELPVSPIDPEKRGDSPENPNKDSDENDSGIATSPANIGTAALTGTSDSNDCNSTNLVLSIGIHKNANLVRSLSMESNALNLERNLEKLNISDDDDNDDLEQQMQNKNILAIKKKKAKQKRVRTQSHSDWNTTIAPRYQCEDGECSIQSCLNNFTAVELMTGNNKVGCDGCTQRINGSEENAKTVYTNATKQFLISSPPAVLILHLKRFQVGARCMFRKLTRAVTFPMILDIAPFCGSKVKNLPNIDRKQKKLLYGLYGIVEHSGGMYGGHYTAFVKVRPKLTKTDKRWKFMPQGSKAELDQTDEQKAKLDELLAKEKARELRMKANDSDDFTSTSSSSDDEKNDKIIIDETQGAIGGSYNDEPDIKAPPGKWYYVSDSRVQEVSEDSVLKAQAYLLFYERIY